MRLKISDLLPGTHYAVEVRADDGPAQSEWSPKLEITTIQDTVPPEAPQNVTWENNGKEFHGEWGAVTTNETGQPSTVVRYEVALTYAGDINVIRYDSVPQNTEGRLSYDLTKEMNRAFFVEPRGAISFRVRAVDNKDLKSDWSAEILAQNPPPEPPTSLAAYGIIGGISLAWEESSSLDVAGYHVYVSDSGSVQMTEANRVTSSPVNINAYTYYTVTMSDLYFRVTAVDEFGQESAMSNLVTGQALSPFGTDATPPDAPTNFAVNILDDATGILLTQRAEATWTGPVNDDTLAGYHIRYKKQGTLSWSTVPVPPDAEQPYVVTRTLEPNTAYDFEIRSYDTSANKSAWVPLSTNAVTPATEPTLTQALVIGGGGYIESESYGQGVGFRIDEDSITIIDGDIRGQAITTGVIQSNEDAEVYDPTANGGLGGFVEDASRPAWSINLGGNAEFNRLAVRGTTVVGDPQNPDSPAAIIQSAAYVPGSEGWVIRSDGFAEFRNLASNIIKAEHIDIDQVTADRLTVGTRGVSILANGSMEDPQIIDGVRNQNGFGGWKIVPYKDPYGFGTARGTIGGTMTENRDVPLSGTRSMRWTTASANDGMMAFTTQIYPVTAGQKWYVSGMFRSQRPIDKSAVTGESLFGMWMSTSTGNKAGTNNTPQDILMYESGADVDTGIEDKERPIGVRPPSSEVQWWDVGSSIETVWAPSEDDIYIYTTYSGSETSPGDAENDDLIRAYGGSYGEFSEKHVGMPITGPNIPEGTVITEIVDPTYARISNTVTANGEGWATVYVDGIFTVTGIVIIPPGHKQMVLSVYADAARDGSPYTCDIDEIKCYPASEGLSIYGIDGNEVASVDVLGNAQFNDLDIGGSLRVNSDSLIIDGAAISDTLYTTDMEIGNSLLVAGKTLLAHIRDNFRVRVAARTNPSNPNTYISAGNGANGAIINDSSFTAKAGHVYRVYYNFTAKNESSGVNAQWMSYLAYTDNGQTLVVENGKSIPGTVFRVRLEEQAWHTFTGMGVITFGVDATIRIGVFVQRAAGSNVGMNISNSSYYTPTLVVEDLGPNIGVQDYLAQRWKDSGANDDSPPPPKEDVDTVSKYSRTWTATWSRGYNSNGGQISAGRDHKVGYYSGTNGNTKAAVGFNDSDIRSKLSGAEIVKVELYLYFNHWYNNSGGTAVLGTHGESAGKSNWGNISAKDPDQKRSGNWPKPGGRWVDVTEWGGGFKGGNNKGVLVGPAPTTSKVYYGHFNGANQGNPPRLRITYRK